MATKKERAHQIRIASLPGENTAERVGALLEDIVDHQDRVDTSLETFNEELAETNRTIEENKAEAAAKISYTPAVRTISLVDSENVVKSITTLPVVTTSVPGLMTAADKSKLDGMPGAFVLDLGQVSSTDVGDAQAAKSEIAGNRNIFAIRYTTQGVSALKTTVIIQWCNGIDVSAQIKFTDNSQWRRNVTGATGVAGAPTNAFQWERTGAHYLGYDAANRKIQLKDYNQKDIKDVQLPLATESQAGLMSGEDKERLNETDCAHWSFAPPLVSGDDVFLPVNDRYGDSVDSVTIPAATLESAGVMSAADKKAVDKIGGIETNVGTLQTTSAYRWNYSGSFDVGTTIPVSQFMTKEALRASLQKPMYIYAGVTTSLRLSNEIVFRLFSQTDEGVVTFSFAVINAEGIERHVLTLNEAEDTWTVTE